MSEQQLYPEHDKLMQVKYESQAIGEFLEYLQGKNIVLATMGDGGRDIVELVSIQKPIQKILAEYFGIDLNKIDQEKKQMIEFLKKND